MTTLAEELSASFARMPELTGEIPDTDSERLTVFLLANSTNFTAEMLPTLLSIIKYDTETAIHIHTVDPPEDASAQLALLRATTPTLQLSATFETTVDQTAAIIPAYMSAVQLIRLCQIQAFSNRYFLTIPSGAVVRRPLRSLLKLLQRSSILLQEKFQDLIAVSPEKMGHVFLGECALTLMNRILDGTLKVGDSKTIKDAVAAFLTGHAGTATIGQIPQNYFGADDAQDRKIWLPSSTHDTHQFDNISRLWSETKGLRVLLLKPRMDLPFKTPSLLTPKSKKLLTAQFGSGDQASLRQHWTTFIDRAALAFRNAGHNPVIVERPMPELTPILANLTQADIAIVPHKNNFQFKGVEMPAIFFMQIAHRWLFTADPNGWGAGARAYPYNSFQDAPSDSGIYEFYSDLICRSNESKFLQPDRMSIEALRAQGELPNDDYLFFPCQIPHDEVVRFFCDVSEHDVVSALTNWANQSKVHMVFKLHPANHASTKPLQEVAKGPYIHWANASIHDLIEHCTAVYTMNSGVGHEAILHGKPIVMFGRAEYDRVAIRASLEDLEGAYARMKSWNKKMKLDDYRRFYHWFTRDFAIDLQDEDHLDASFCRLVRIAEDLCS